MEKVAGIIAEYNPMHRGHVYHIAETRRALGADCAVVCALSSDFVQRGSPAVFDKFTRAESAVRAGADLVLELPLPWSLASAEGFARGGASLLAASGVVTHLSFGSECGELRPLRAAAEALCDPAFPDALRAELKTGVSFPRARQAALERTLGADAAVLAEPNNLLAVEYLRAIRELVLPLGAVTVRRLGARHDQAGEGDYPSASQLRAMLEAGEQIDEYVPMSLAGAEPVFPGDLEVAVLSRLRMLPPAAFAETPGAEEGLENVLCRAVHSEASLEDIWLAAKSKRYPMSRLRRMTYCAALGVTKAISEGLPPYLRVLAANERGRALLRRMAKESALPVVTKPASVKELGERAYAVFSLTAAAHDLYVLAKNDKTPGADWKTSPIII